MNISVLVGSIRKESFNKALAIHIINRFSDRINFQILSIDELPFFNEDIELSPPKIVSELRKTIKESDGILIVTPEYNYSVPGVLKNALDWFSRVDRVMLNKPTMVIGASTGRFGTVRGQNHLRQILNSSGIRAINLPGNETHISFVEDKLDEEGILIDESTVIIIDKRMNSFMNWIKKINQ